MIAVERWPPMKIYVISDYFLPGVSVTITASTPIAAARKVLRQGRKLRMDSRYDLGKALGVAIEDENGNLHLACRVRFKDYAVPSPESIRLDFARRGIFY
jgi:hypothetical protein